jgi:hypothetical protein
MVVESIREWTIRDYLDRRGDNVVRDWISSLPISAQAKVDSILLILQAYKIWPAQYVSALRGYKQIYEIRVGCSGVQYRPLGCYGPDRGEFTILVGSVEKGGKLPKGDCEAAVERRNAILNEKGRTCEHDFS